MLNRDRFHGIANYGNKMNEDNFCTQKREEFSDEFLKNYSAQRKASKNVEKSHYEDLNRVLGIQRVDSGVSDVADSLWMYQTASDVSLPVKLKVLCSFNKGKDLTSLVMGSLNTLEASLIISDV
ncbi:PB1 domain-containing protein tyrosine kinase [Raphanus sativus]|nr:PB1 domain-containing protein tyrosine kinase [Raphanus sativus]